MGEKFGIALEVGCAARTGPNAQAQTRQRIARCVMGSLPPRPVHYIPIRVVGEPPLPQRAKRKIEFGIGAGALPPRAGSDRDLAEDDAFAVGRIKIDAQEVVSGGERFRDLDHARQAARRLDDRSQRITERDIEYLPIAIEKASRVPPEAVEMHPDKMAAAVEDETFVIDLRSGIEGPTQ